MLLFLFLALPGCAAAQAAAPAPPLRLPAFLQVSAAVPPMPAPPNLFDALVPALSAAGPVLPMALPLLFGNGGGSGLGGLIGDLEHKYKGDVERLGNTILPSVQQMIGGNANTTKDQNQAAPGTDQSSVLPPTVTPSTTAHAPKAAPSSLSNWMGMMQPSSDGGGYLSSLLGTGASNGFHLPVDASSLASTAASAAGAAFKAFQPMDAANAAGAAFKAFQTSHSSNNEPAAPASANDGGFSAMMMPLMASHHVEHDPISDKGEQALNHNIGSFLGSLSATVKDSSTQNGEMLSAMSKLASMGGQSMMSLGSGGSIGAAMLGGY